MRMRQLLVLFPLTILSLNLTTVQSSFPSPLFTIHTSRAVEYLVKRVNPALGLIYESDDPGDHWLRAEMADFKWRYNETYWLYSDNLFAAFALNPFRADIANRIRQALERYPVPSSGLFEVVTGEAIPIIRNAVNYVVQSSSKYVIVARRHDFPMISYGLYADLICYRSLQSFVEGRIREAHRLLLQAISLWNGKGLDDWSFRVVDGFHSNQKLALLLYTSKVLGMKFDAYDQMERHLWSMQHSDGGLAALSDGDGKPMGSSNTETTALALLIYNDALVQSIRSRVQASGQSYAGFYAVAVLFLSVSVAALSPSRKSKRLCSPRAVDWVQPSE